MNIKQIIQMFNLPQEVANIGIPPRDMLIIIADLQKIGDNGTWFRDLKVWTAAKQKGKDHVLGMAIRQKFGIPSNAATNFKPKQLLEAVAEFQKLNIQPNNLNAWSDYMGVKAGKAKAQDFVAKYTQKSASVNKLAVIRDEDNKPCPFGLPIISGCQNVGKAISRMAPIDSDESDVKQEQVKKANQLIYAYHKTGNRCPFADKIVKDFDKVDCDFGDTGEGNRSTPFRGSPIYPQTFRGLGADGLHGYPLGFYSDFNQSRNLFFGLFSLIGGKSPERLVKLADKYDESGEKEKADIIDAILESVDDIDDTEKLQILEDFLTEYREKYNDKRMDSGFLFQLAEKWFGPRQYNISR